MTPVCREKSQHNNS